MPLDDTRARARPIAKVAKPDAIAAGFAEIVRIIGVPMPASKAKGTRLAKAETSWKVYRGQKVRRLVEKLWENIMAEAVRQDVIPDHLEHPEPPGTNRMVYVGEAVEISLAVSEPVEGINFEGFVADLLKAEVKPALIKRLTRRHRTETRAAHKFTASLMIG